MERKIELLAPGGDVDAIKAAILAGANAIYCGLDKFNARNRAANISFNDLQGILRLAHQHDCEIFITLNIIIIESEIPALINLLNKLANTSIDGVIVQDLGMLYLLNKYYKSLDVHASTQMTTHNQGQIKFLSNLDVSRVNLSRELNINEIKELSNVGYENQILTEVFVHGSNCISFSGLCYISSVQTGNSGNRGRCSQPCRDRYVRTPEGKDYPLNLKDNSAYFDIKELYEAGVYSLKIEGRIKKADYVYTVVDSWKKNIQSLYTQQEEKPDNSILYKVFNRDFSNTYLKGEINKDMFIDNPRDHSIEHLSVVNSFASPEKLEEAHLALYKEKEAMMRFVETKIEGIRAERAALSICFSGSCNEPLKVEIQTPDTFFELSSEMVLVKKERDSLNEAMILKRFKTLNETEYFIERLDLKGLGVGLFIPFKELTSLKNKALFLLNGSKEMLKPIKLPKLKTGSPRVEKAKLSILISSADDLYLGEVSSADLYFQLPNRLTNSLDSYISLFKANKSLIPYFPSVIIGEDFEAALEFLTQIKPKLIVSNNTGIAYEAFIRGIAWLAGPQLNLTNSYSLLNLKENLACSGAFISNELNCNQLKQIKCPEDFELYYSIYHPIVLMTSRQCLFHQVTGCEKNQFDATCIQNCDQTSSITNMKKEPLIIEKSKGNYHKIYNASNYLNTDIVKDLPHTFSHFSIDLRDIETATKLKVDKAELIHCFESLIKGESESAQVLHKLIDSTTCIQYKKGI
ncbi:U32 family peptidase [Ancylomarina euxinus]|uniref:U32 family peptidase n=1 Tax=Ancylomarina euxinus TaxID=2283627 RepID=A0A425XYV7_9BACT|nr:DUF3656 domain-containing protein [Ancylomarina euxinus]MCZ4695711.1 DUF3656 domain-containing protein [Ancylomarina euxinus]MUP16164.1 U32 family peptidase [Ancylomarina euxinus]RRG20091.1 U32 family peptidase [Ancylomarina euxinus]